MILGMPFTCIGDTSLAKVHQISLSHLREKMTRLRQKPKGGGMGRRKSCLNQDADYELHVIYPVVFSCDSQSNRMT